jgi:acylglycerol lipase
LTDLCSARFGETALNKEHKSPGSAYGKNTRTELLGDVQFMLDHLRTKAKTEILFLYGHSMVFNYSKKLDII